MVTHKTLLTSVWGPAHGEDMHYLRVFIGQLRGKIERDPDGPEDHPHRAGRRLPLCRGLTAPPSDVRFLRADGTVGMTGMRRKAAIRYLVAKPFAD